jgi:hypothetical protein
LAKGAVLLTLAVSACFCWRPLVEAHIALAPGAEDNPLAAWACTRIRHNVRARAEARADLDAMRATVALVAPDEQLQATLRFDHGYLTVHEGLVGIPDVTLCADDADLRALAELPFWRGIPDVRKRSWREAALELVSGEVKIYGLVTRPRLVLRLLRVLAPPTAPERRTVEPPAP